MSSPCPPPTNCVLFSAPFPPHGLRLNCPFSDRGDPLPAARPASEASSEYLFTMLAFMFFFITLCSQLLALRP